MERDNKGKFLASNVRVWEAGVGYFENLPPDKMLHEMGFDSAKYKYVKSWSGTKGKNKIPRFYVAVATKKGS